MFGYFFKEAVLLFLGYLIIIGNNASPTEINSPPPPGNGGPPPPPGNGKPPPRPANGKPPPHPEKGEPPQPGIVGGDSAYGSNQFPYIVSIQRYSTAKGKWVHWCGGTIASSKVILTAAHCIDMITKPPEELKVCDHAQYASLCKLQDVKGIEIYPKWDPSSMDHDVAVIVLKTALNLGPNSGMKAVTLPSKNGNDYRAGREGVVSGWGDMEEGAKEGTDLLRYVRVSIYSDVACKGFYPGEITDNMICAGVDAGKKDSCQGDSGGPLNIPGTPWLQLGIVSWGHGCRKGKPGIYTKVVNYNDWIQAKISKYQ